MATVFSFLHIGCTLAPPGKPSMCGGDAALCQITLTTCYFYAGRFMLPVIISYYVLNSYSFDAFY